MDRKQQEKSQKKESSNNAALYLRRLSIGFGAVFVLTLLCAAAPLLAQTQAEQAETAPTEEELELKRELDRIGEEIAELRGNLRELRDEKETIENRIEQIATEIHRTELQIARSEIAIRSLELERAAIEDDIAQIEIEMAEHRVSIGEILRDIAVSDDIPFYAVLLSGGSLSDVADALEESRKVQEQLLGAVGSLRDAQDDLAAKEEELFARQEEEEQAKGLLVVAREDLLIKRTLEEDLVAASEAAEAAVTRELSVQELDAARIRRQLFPLAETDGGLTFEEAYLIAKPLSAAVGIRPAFLLAILQKETHLGELKGTGTWRIDMHPRDWDAFIQITSELGLNPDEVPVSRAPSYGWGGAMGPAQFLPQTWLGYRDRVAEITGHHPPNPWVIEDAFAAAAVKLASGGATAQTPASEWKSAMIYFAGGNWDNPAYAFYGDAVEDLTAQFAAMIEILEADISRKEMDSETEAQ